MPHSDTGRGRPAQVFSYRRAFRRAKGLLMASQGIWLALPRAPNGAPSLSRGKQVPLVSAAPRGMRGHFVYIVRCADGSYYVGSAANVAERVKAHNAGRAAAFTALRRPVELAYMERHPRRLSAIQRERQLKKWGRAKKEALIRGDLAALRQLSR